MRENGVEYLVVKNRLFKIVFKEFGVEDSFDEILEGLIVFVFGYNDLVVFVKVVFDLVKVKVKVKLDVFKIKGGYLIGKKVSVKEVEELVKLFLRE